MRTWGRATAVLVACGGLLLTGHATAIRAQGQAAAVSIDLRVARPWFGPDDPLAFDVEVRNPGGEALGDLRVSVALFERVRSRSALRQAFEGELSSTPLEAFTFRLPDMPAGTSDELRVSRALPELEAFAGAPDGVYPLSVTVRRSTGPALTGRVAAVAFLGSPPPLPLRLLPVLVVAPDPLLAPDGDLTRGAAGVLDELSAGLDALGSQAPVGLAVRPSLFGELRALPDDRGALDALVDIASGAEVLTVPRPWAALPHLTGDGDGSLAGALAGAGGVLERRLGSAPVPVLHPPGLALDGDALDALEDPGLGLEAALVDGDALRDGALTPSQPVGSGELLLLPADGSLADGLEAAAGSLDVARLVAETAMLYFESPGRERVVATPMPATEQAAAFLDAAAEAPWLDAIAPSAAARLEAQGGTPVSAEIPDPPDAYRDALSDAASATDAIAAYTLEDNAVVGRLRVTLDAARSTALWSSEWTAAVAYSRAIVREFRDQRRLLEVPEGPVTFTSSRGEVPVTVFNRADYPVRIRLELSSPKIRFPEGGVVVIDRLEPPGETITFPAVTASSGTFPLTVRVTSADGAVPLASGELIVRSTAFNALALGLTSAAAVFLVVWYAWRFVRRRRGADA